MARVTLAFPRATRHLLKAKVPVPSLYVTRPGGCAEDSAWTLCNEAWRLCHARVLKMGFQY